MKRLLTGCILILALAVLLSGCGGGGGGSSKLNESGDASLQSSDMYFNGGQYCDLRSFTATRNGYVVVEMTKSGSYPMSDPAVRGVRGLCESASDYNNSFNNYGYLFSDDDSGGSLNARAVYSASRDQEFTVAFTSYSAGDTGSYHWHVYETDSPYSGTSVNGSSPAKKPIPEVKNGGLIRVTATKGGK